ncbi:MAG TPA: T9SS type A sorting domain-containing protein, partial [Flavobacteriales bacterium]|nr:T9SS type A sorting domain-containing protein [Flavobacteriales bacterium]
NTLVNEKVNGSFFQSPPEVYIKAYNNVLAGGGEFMSAWPDDMDTLANLRITDIIAADFADPDDYDYHITGSSPAFGIGQPAGLGSSGYPLVALYEYVHPANSVLRCQHALLDAGAFEACPTGMYAMDGPDVELFPNPATEQLTIRAASNANITGIELTDTRGRMVARATGPARQRWDLDLHGIVPGHFTARITTSTGSRLMPFVKLP